MINSNLTLNLTQTTNPPFDDLVLVAAYKNLLDSSIEWDSVGTLFDENNQNTLIVILNNQTVLAVFRMCISVEDSIRALNFLKRDSGSLFLGYFQERPLLISEIQSLEAINKIWSMIADQISEASTEQMEEYFKRVDSQAKESGRGKSFSTDTKRRVMQYSHGRCMFEGCGEDLGLDKLTGYEGNFSYLAHNVASSEQGERGGIVISELLSDDPHNILLLCDKHHRLIDKIATVDYSALRLSNMRKQYGVVTKKLLNGLSYPPISSFAVLWPVNGHVIAPPSESHVAQCLTAIRYRMDNTLNIINDNDEILRESDIDMIWSLMPKEINRIAEKILMQTRSSQYKAALFAFGLMPALTGLGAKLGNKNEIIPMLRYRDGGMWMWPAEKPVGKTYSIFGVSALTKEENEVVLSLSFTAKPDLFSTIAANIKQTTSAKHISIEANEFGNGVIGHPTDGMQFLKEIQVLLHLLQDRHKVKKIHLLLCASNVACVLFGQAIDNHHPEILVYDFHKKTMIPRLNLKDGELSQPNLPAINITLST